MTNELERNAMEKRCANALEQLKAARKPKEAGWMALQLHADGKVPISPKNPSQAKCQSSSLATTGYRLARHIQRIYTETSQRMKFATHSPLKGQLIQDSLRLIVEYWLNENKFQRQLPSIVKSAYFSSYHILRVYPDVQFKRRPVANLVPSLQNVVPKGFEYEVGYQTTPGLRIQHISPLDFWVSTDQEVRVCRYRMSPQQFRQYADGYLKVAGVNVDEVLKELNTTAANRDTLEGTMPTERDRALGLQNALYAGGAPVELFHFEGNIAELADDQKLLGGAMTFVQVKEGALRLIQSPALRPYWDGSASDYVYGSPFIEDFLPYPRSLFEDYRPYAQHQTELYNLILDGTAMRTVPPYEIDPRFWGDPNHPGGSSRYLYPGRGFVNPNIGTRKAFEISNMGEMPPSVLQVYAGIDRKIQELQVNEITQGLPTSKGRPTATEMQLKSGYTDENRMDYVATIEEALIEPLVLKLVALIVQFQYEFVEDPDMMQLLGKQKCMELDALTTQDRIEIAQATRSITVRAMAETARAQNNIQALMALMSVVGQLPKEAVQMMATHATTIDLAEFIALALDAMPFDTTKLVSRNGNVQAPALLKQLMDAKAQGASLEGLAGEGGGGPTAPEGAMV